LGGAVFRRRWKWFGKLKSEDGSSLWYGHREITYRDDRGTFSFGYEDGFLFPTPFQVDGPPISFTQPELDALLARIIAAVRSDGQAIQLFGKRPNS
jgi:hypothetical protein